MKYAIVLTLLFLISCQMPTQGDKIEISTTIFPLHEFASAVASERADVSLIIEGGSDPHTFEPSPQDIIAITRSDLFIYMSPMLEPWAEEMASEKAASFAASSVSELREGHEDEESHEGYDPHIWLSFENDMTIVDEIARQLTVIDPEGADAYRANADAYNQELRELQQSYGEGLEDCDTKTLVLAGHSAFGYLAADNNLTEVAVLGLSPDSEPSAMKVRELSNLVNEQGIRYIFFEDLVSPRTAEVIAEQTGAEVLELSPSHSQTGGRTFIETMQDNLQQLRIGLGCR